MRSGRLGGRIDAILNRALGMRVARGGGGPCRDRTYDQEIKSLLLYQLS